MAGDSQVDLAAKEWRMIAACPKCQTRYRVEVERLGPEGARLRCSSCSAVFRVRRPESTPVSVAAPPLQELAAPSQPVAATPPVAVPPRPAARAARAAEAPPAEGPRFDRERLVLIAHPNPDVCKQLAEALESEGLQVLVAHDGVEAMLSIQRALPRAVVLDAALPKMFGFQVCEIVKRNESLRTIQVCLMGAIHKEDRYRRPPNELYGADFYVEPPALPGGLVEWLERVGLPLRGRPGTSPAPETPPVADHPRAAPTAAREALRARVEPTPVAPSEPRAALREPSNEPAAAARPAAPAKLTLGRVGSAPVAPATPLDAERAKAERLARIIVSDIVLYNEEKFAAAVRSGNPVDALRDELEEGRALFRERIDARIRDERDFLADELERVARARGMA